MVPNHRILFISSVQKELQEERQVIKNFVQGDALLYLAHYIEKVETGTLDMIAWC
ncbi:MAG: hypothetical protein JRH08_04410 [Deltaproteobacteria bacterium]|nr:hypothetical protein [Deltaproteobacteria bacterium]MBW1930171.1 hypothetical protein [Deltaproteobacteria bacterium]MBW2024913.1 hypothetical protein [Deltaproteobacteria bacterium]MBW2124943.1 hypothetical protein [Deltaproteobacteria bacterium]